ncbi:MAG: hypothetical protein ABI016_11875 [Chthoniobacterales bacterium]
MGPISIADFKLPIANFLRQSGRWLAISVELAILTALILTTRCANYADVFVGGKIYFVDADCYSRMTRARLVAEYPGLIVRQHDFENFPTGTVPHTTAPLDYLIVALAGALGPFTAQPLDLAGALISPLLAVLGGWFLYWWSRRMTGPGRLLALLVYALSAILVHGTALGRPDQQGLLLVLLLIALGAEWRLQENPSRGWGIVSGLSWGVALWVSLFEPLILLGAVVLASSFFARRQLLARPRWAGWAILGGIVMLGALVERRLPEWPGAQAYFASWASTIGELKPVHLTSLLWLHWSSGLLLVGPLLLFLALRRRLLPPVLAGLLFLAFCLTFWEARWGYFFAVLFVLTLPAQLSVVRRKWLASLLALIALLPLLQFWDGRLWPNEELAQARAADRRAAVEWRAVASSLAGRPREAVLAPWWLAPATAYWSGQPVVAGSSHESLPGIVESARFFLATGPETAREILQGHAVRWVLADDSERVLENSAALLGVAILPGALGQTLDRSPSQSPVFLVLTRQEGSAKLYQVRDSREISAP